MFDLYSSNQNYWLFLFSIPTAFYIDYLFGEPLRFHPLITFGRIAEHTEHLCNRKPSTQSSKIKGIIVVIACISLPVFTFSLCIFFLPSTDLFTFLINSITLYFTIGWRSLHEHALAIKTPLVKNKLAEARLAVSHIVSRDTAQLDEEQVVTAAIESILENGSDAVFAPLFWFMVGGPIAALFYRFANTLDAMWGYKNERYLYFGWAAARLDDVLNFIPARLCAFCYALAGNTQNAFYCWRQQGADWKSPNAGPVMSSGAGALGLRLGGKAIYDQQFVDRLQLGNGRLPFSIDIQRALKLLDYSLIIGLFILFNCSFLLYLLIDI